MIEIYLNDTRADVAKDTAIGLTKEPFNIMNVPSTKITHSNTFKLPRTPSNNLIFEFAAVSGNQSDVPYDQLSCKIVDGFVIGRGYAVLNSVDERYYNVTFYENTKAFVDLASSTTVGDVVDTFDGTVLDVTLSDALNELIGGTTGFQYPLQSQYTDSTPQVLISTERGVASGPVKGSDLWLSVDKLIDTLCDDNDYTYTNNTGVDLHINLNQVTLKYTAAGGYQIVFSEVFTESNTYVEYTMLDLIRVFAQKLNSFIDIDENAKTVELTEFASLYATSDHSLNDKLATFTKKFVMSTYGQSNVVTFKPDDDVELGQYEMTFSVNNSNIDAIKKYLEIDSLAPKYLYYSAFDWNDYEIAPEAAAIPMMQVDTTDTESVTVELKYRDGGPLTSDTSTKNLPRLKWYDSTAFYTDMETPVLDKVVMFNAEVNIDSIDYLNINPSKRYFFEVLGGDFIINKISGFNPSTKKPTKLELIKIR